MEDWSASSPRAVGSSILGSPYGTMLLLVSDGCSSLNLRSAALLSQAVGFARGIRSFPKMPHNFEVPSLSPRISPATFSPIVSSHYLMSRLRIQGNRFCNVHSLGL